MAYVSTYEEFCKLKNNHEIHNNLSYVAVKGIGVKKKDEELDIRNSKKWHIVDQKSRYEPAIDSSSPFYIVGRRIFDCHQGPDRHRKKKEMRKNSQLADHDHKHTRRLVESKKVGCCAQAKVREVLVMTSIQIGSLSRSSRFKAKALIKEILRGPNFSVSLLERRFYYSFAKLEDHSGHEIGEATAHLLPINALVRAKVEQLVNNGMRRPKEIKSQLESYVKNELFDGNPPPSSNRRFNPTTKDLANIARSARVKQMSDIEDCETQCIPMIIDIQQPGPFDIPTVAYVSTYDEFLKLKEGYEIHNNLSFVAVKGIGVRKKDEELDIRNSKKWHIVDQKSRYEPAIDSSSPFYVVGRRIFDCHQGPDRHRKKKEMRKNSQSTDHAHKHRRGHVQGKKVGCSAQVKVREVLVMTSVQEHIDILDYAYLSSYMNVQIGSPDRSNRSKVRALIKEILCGPNFSVSLLERRFYYSFAKLEDHSGHEIGEATAHLLPIDPLVRAKVEDLVNNGMRRPKEIRSHVESYVKNELFDGNPPPSSNRRFNPSIKDMANIVQSTLAKQRHSFDDQINVAQSIEVSHTTAHDNRLILTEKSSETLNVQEEFCMENVVVQTITDVC